MEEDEAAAEAETEGASLFASLRWGAAGGGLLVSSPLGRAVSPFSSTAVPRRLASFALRTRLARSGLEAVPTLLYMLLRLTSSNAAGFSGVVADGGGTERVACEGTGEGETGAGELAGEGWSWSSRETEPRRVLPRRVSSRPSAKTTVSPELSIESNWDSVTREIRRAAREPTPTSIPLGRATRRGARGGGGVSAGRGRGGEGERERGEVQKASNELGKSKSARGKEERPERKPTPQPELAATQHASFFLPPSLLLSQRTALRSDARSVSLAAQVSRRVAQRLPRLFPLLSPRRHPHLQNSPGSSHRQLSSLAPSTPTRDQTAHSLTRALIQDGPTLRPTSYTNLTRSFFTDYRPFADFVASYLLFARDADLDSMDPSTALAAYQLLEDCFK